MAKPDFNMSEADVLDLVKQVQVELAGIAKTEAEKATRLAKSVEGSKGEPEKSSAPAGESAPAPSAEPSAPAAEPFAPPAAPVAPSADPSAPPADPSAAPADAGAPAAGPSFEELVTLYSQLPPEGIHAPPAPTHARRPAPAGRHA